MSDGRFKKGNKPWNKDKKGIHLSIDSEFKAGEQHTGDSHPSWNGGVQQMANDCAYLHDGNGKRKRRPRVIYEEGIGEIPKGFIIIHIDGDNKNDSPLNLEAISRKELLRRNNLKRKEN